MLKSEILANLPKWHKRANELLKGDAKKERPKLVIPAKPSKKDLVALAKPLLAVLKKYGEEKVRVKPGSDDDIVDVKKPDPKKPDPKKPEKGPKGDKGDPGKGLKGDKGDPGASGSSTGGSGSSMTPLWVIAAILAFLVFAAAIMTGAGLIGIGAAVSDSGAVSGGGTTEVVVVDRDTPPVVIVDSGPSREWKAWANAHDGNSRYFFAGD